MSSTTETKIEGVYYESKHFTVGTMGTTKKSDKTEDIHYYAKEKADKPAEVDLFMVTPDGRNMGIHVETVARDAFGQRFKDCSNHTCIYSQKKMTAEDKQAVKAKERVAVAETHMQKKEFNAAAFEFGRAVKMDENNVQAHFGKGKAHIALGEFDKAKESFDKLSEIDALYEAENKHLFNEFGIELRKQGMYDRAISNYEKAIELDKNDEILLYNLARAYKEKGEMDKAVSILKQSLQINPDFKEGIEYYELLTKKAYQKG